MSSNVATRDNILEMKGITKEFTGVRALDKVTLEVKRGEVHAICGENGAGKSTLMKVLSGVYPYGTYTGDVVFSGQVAKFATIKESERSGIVIIHQELALIPELSIAENIFLGNELMSAGLIDWQNTQMRTRDLLARVGLEADPSTPIKNLGVGQQQLVEIAKALSKNVSLLILDEPTSALNEEDSANLLDLMRSLRSKGITCIMISHKLNEIAEISDSITVIRDGKTVDRISVDDGHVDEDTIIRAMVGRSLDNRYPEHQPSIGDVIFKVEDWTVEDPNVPGRLLCDHIDFNIRAGEIVGFAGLMGAGRTEMARSLFGRNYGIYRGGSITIRGRKTVFRSVSEAIRNGLAYVPEDRKLLGLNLLDSIEETTVSANMREILTHRLIDFSKQRSVAEKFRDSLRIKAQAVDVGVSTLSGGNQQKVVLSKWMFPNPDVLILDEPTRGIDVGAKYEIYKLVHQLADEGKAVIFISSELPEILGMTDRIYTICEGRISGEMNTQDADQESLMRLMTTTLVA
ncbi:sugar ABC transporter ATP-binding protein [Bifidobacterium psychraerophilum]|uniref:ABC transporter n=1 Tax=Bifidobacterium psychraerophilum TaxID=218140 RepID=A0A087CG66_9BIFI|nr:ATP-binding cassette domain-containing protein [Bifidobacterium psychraerophilum]KFI82266.1 ABC transporter [Bifidobacterium psychraerophilum]PKA95071.1 monosaccharide ABC transporter ATP-binding protein (CUT2 family) [Bifidobacterium psychraerophilum DSM 22366]